VGNFQLKTNAYKCAHMEKAPTHSSVCVCVEENCDFACLFIGLRHLPSYSSAPPAFSCWLLKVSQSTSTSTYIEAAGCECGKKIHSYGIGTHSCGHISRISDYMTRVSNIGGNQRELCKACNL